MHRVHALREHQTCVHQIAVAPAAVALDLVKQIRRRFFVAALQVVRDPHAVAGTPHQRSFDKVMRQDLSRERAAAGQRCQGAMLHERLEPNDRVVPPIVRFAELPVMQARGE